MIAATLLATIGATVLAMELALASVSATSITSFEAAVAAIKAALATMFVFTITLKALLEGCPVAGTTYCLALTSRTDPASIPVGRPI